MANSMIPLISYYPSSQYMNTEGTTARSRQYITKNLVMTYSLENINTSSLVKGHDVDPLHSSLQSFNDERAVGVNDIVFRVRNLFPSYKYLVGTADPDNENATNIPQYFIPPSFLIKTVTLYFIYGDIKRDSLLGQFIQRQTAWPATVHNFVTAVKGEILKCVPVDWDGSYGSTIEYTLPNLIILPGKTLYVLVEYSHNEDQTASAMFYKLTGTINCQIQASYYLVSVDAKTIPGYPFTRVATDIWTISPI